jgi:hypothetical protein
VIKLEKNNDKYKIPNCTPNQLIRFLKALKEGGANQHLINVLVKDKDAHHQRGMAMKLGLAEKLEGKYILTDLGKHIVSLIGTDEFAEIFRENCIPRVQIFRDVLRLIKLEKEMTKDELKENIKNLVKPDQEWSLSTLDQYANLIIGYFKICGLIEYRRKGKLIKYISNAP